MSYETKFYLHDNNFGISSGVPYKAKHITSEDVTVVFSGGLTYMCTDEGQSRINLITLFSLHLFLSHFV